MNKNENRQQICNQKTSRTTIKPSPLGFVPDGQDQLQSMSVHFMRWKIVRIGFSNPENVHFPPTESRCLLRASPPFLQLINPQNN